MEIIIYFVSMFILYMIISAATHSYKMKKNSEAQVKLLMKIAEKNGVSPEEINQAVK